MGKELLRCAKARSRSDKRCKAEELHGTEAHRDGKEERGIAEDLHFTAELRKGNDKNGADRKRIALE